MPAFNFQTRFADVVERGEKTQTIRAMRKRMPRVGQTAYLYTGLRTKMCRKLRKGVLIEVSEVWIYPYSLRIGKKSFDGAYLNEFARTDGFIDWQELIGWFKDTHGVPFKGILVRWKVT